MRTMLIEVSQKVLLLVNETKMWFEHLNNIDENRKKGLEKAAAIRRAKNCKVIKV